MLLSFLLLVSTPQMNVPSTPAIPFEENIPLPPVPSINFADRLYLVKRVAKNEGRKKFAGNYRGQSFKNIAKRAKKNGRKRKFSNVQRGRVPSTGTVVTETIWLT